MKFWLTLLYIVLGFVALVLLWHFATRKYLNPFKLYFLFGPKGSGKTTLETKLAVKYMKKGWHVYSDLPELFVPGIRFYKSKDLGEFVPEANSLLIIGEAGVKFDKRHFKTFPPELRDFFVFQRKYKVVCYMDSQTFDVDSKIRDRVDGMYLLQNIGRVFSIARRIGKKVTLVQSTAESNSRIAEDLYFMSPFWWHFTYIPHWVNMFDSGAIIDKKPYLSYTVVGEDSFTPAIPGNSGSDSCGDIPEDPYDALAELNRVFGFDN